jgi:hypothetical protein
MQPSAGKLVVNEDTSFVFSDAPDGFYFFQWQLLVQGQASGPVATVVLAVGAFSAYASGLLAELRLSVPSAHVVIGRGSGVSVSGVLAPLVFTAPRGHIVPNSPGGVVLSAESIAAIVEAVMVRIKNDPSTLTVSKFLGLK